MSRLSEAVPAKADRRGLVLRAAGVVVAVALAAVAAHRWLPVPTTAPGVRATLLDFGPYAPVAFVGIQTAQVVVAPIPGQVLGIAAGYVFGAFWGTVYSMLGVTIGSALAIGLARRLGRPYVEGVVDDDALERFDDVVAERGVPVLFVMFLLPVFPDDAICFVAGLTDIRIRTLLALVVVGRTPAFLAVNLAGGSAARTGFLEAGVLLAAVTGVGLAGYIARDRLTTVVERYLPS